MLTAGFGWTPGRPVERGRRRAQRERRDERFSEGLSASPSAAHAAAGAKTQNLDVPINMIIGNPCNAESVAISGMLHELVHITADSSSGYDLNSHINFQDVSGVGLTTGTTYEVGNSADVLHENLRHASTGASEGDSAESIHFISQGSAPNFDAQFLFHAKINAKGQVTSQVAKIDPDCNG